MTKIILGEHTWADLEPYLDQALELSGRELEEYMAALAAERPTIAAALTGLLADSAELKSKSFLEQPVMVPADNSLAGQQVGPYTLDSLIGRGGMGEVWLALRSDGRFEGKFAIKFLDSYSASPAALDRFRREGRLLARLAHPHIARLIDAGVTSGGRPYLVLEYVEGERIDAYCRSHSLGIEARVRLLLDVLSALAHAHGNLVVHRDIKPSNVLVTADGVAKLLDFGIAKLLNPDADATDVGAPTRIEDAALTPDYAAPEQLLGEPATTATDVYQVGVLMFVLFAGRLPFAASTSRAERIKAALDAEPPRLSAAALVSRKELRGDLDAIVAKALRKLPQERYATAAALADDLKRYLGHEPVAARANLLSYRAGKFVRRYRAAVIGTSAAILALIAVAAFALIQMREAEIERDRSRAQAKRAEMQAEFVTLMMSTVGDRPTTAEQLLDAGVQLLDKHYTADVRFRFTAMVNLASRYSDLGLSNKQFALLERADGIARELNDPALIARSQCGLAQAEIDLGHMDKAVARVAEGRASLARLPEPDPLYVEDCTEAEADLSDAQGNPGAATHIAERALALLEQAGEIHDIRYSELLGRIADYYKEAGDSHRGLEYVERALAAAERSGLGNTDAAMTAMHNLASSLMNVGEVNEACAREREVISRVQSTGRTVITAMAVLNGTCFLKAGDASLALTWYEQGLAAARTENEAYLQMHARAYRARALIELHRYAEAAAELDQVAALAQQHIPSGEVPATRAQIFRAELLLAEGRADDAQRTIQPLLPGLRAPRGSERVLLPAALLLSARIAMAQRRYTDAADLSSEALRETLRRARDPAKSADVGESWLTLARARGALNDANGMHEAAQRAATSLTASLGAENALTRAASAL
jgi:eukaryotic-like serine/threonine-protein kinase